MAEYVIKYHTNFTFCGRIEFIRIMFEDAGVKYTEQSEDMYQLVDCFTEGKGAAPFPVMFPPLLIHGDVCINNTPAIMRYLGKQLGYYPKTDKDEAIADQILLNAHDFIAEGRRQFHPTEDSASYHSQKEAADLQAAKWAASGRLLTWLRHFNKVIERGSGPGVAGACVTYADFALFHVLRATQSQFPEAWESNKGEYQACVTYLEAFAGRKGISEYLGSDRRRPFEGNSMM